MTSFIQQALVFFGASVILVPIFQQLRLGSVIGFLIAGILVGPHGLKLIHESESIIHFAELGVVLLLFLIGLEIRPGKLWAMRRHLFGLGGLQVLVTTVLFTLIGIWLQVPIVTAGVIGFGLSLSSTAFALQTLTEKNQLNTEFGRASFSILLMQDLVAIPALALIPVLRAQSTAGDGLSLGHVALVTGVFAFFLIANRFLIRPALRFIASTHSQEIFTAAALFVVLGVAALMQLIGLSAALGTFIAGVLLADSEYRHEIETNLEPFKGLLMGLFFIGIGMGVSLDLIASRPLLVAGLAIGYLLCKAGVIYGVSRLFALSHENSKRAALTIAQGGEFAFVIFTMARQFEIAPSETLSLLTAVITLSMAINPLFMVLDERLGVRRKGLINPTYDEIKDEAPEVIIAGFGRFGQVFGRLLRAQEIPFVAIDHDPDQIELVRRFGSKVYYGDASRIDLLEKAGAAKAKYFILAIDDVAASLSAAKLVRDHYPQIKIFARARNRGHAFDLMELGIKAVKREVFDSSVDFSGDLLIEMGYERDAVRQIVERFRRHDELMLQEQFKVRNDDKMFVSVSKQATAQLAQVLREDETKTYVDPVKT